MRTERPPSLEECQAVMRAAGQEQNALQSRALITLLWHAGMRREEAANARCEHLAPYRRGKRLVGYTLTIPCGKGGRARTVGLSVENAEPLLRGKVGPILHTRTGQKLHLRWINRVVERIVKRANCPLAFTPHDFRHAFAHQLVQDGAQLVQVMSLMGHASVRTTEIYLHQIGATDAVDFAIRRET